jgi:hypothetical protein
VQLPDAGDVLEASLDPATTTGAFGSHSNRVMISPPTWNVSIPFGPAASTTSSPP